MKRRSLSERNRAAIAADPDPSAPEPTTDPVQPPDAPPVIAETLPDSEKASANASRGTVTAGAGETVRLGVYITPSDFADAKAAYLADWNNGGEADTFARWVGAAIDTYAGRTPHQRAATAQPRERAASRTGSTRSFTIAAAIVGRMRAAITADQQNGRWPSDSAWCGEAIAYAVEAARTRDGGALPTPPPRLPNRLTR